MKMFNFTQSTSKRRIGLAIARGIGWATILSSMHCFGWGHTNCGGATAESLNCAAGTTCKAVVSTNCRVGSPMYYMTLYIAGNSVYITNNGYNSFQPPLSSSGSANYGDSVQQQGFFDNGSCPSHLETNYGNGRNIYGARSFSPNTLYCGFFKTDTHIITVEAQTGATVDSTWNSVNFQAHEFNRAPEFSSSSTVSVAENQTDVLYVTASDPNSGDYVVSNSYAIGSGGDGNAFNIDPSNGRLTFKTAPDYETKQVYNVWVEAQDSLNLKGDQNITVNVTDVNDTNPPVITSPATVTVAENQTAVLTVTATDAEGDTITYSVSGGADSASFSIDSSTGVLTFNTAPDFETQSSYTVEVTASDGLDADTQTFTVTVTDVHEGPVSPPPITSPDPATPLTGDTETINWTTTPGATNYLVQAGTSAGRNDLYQSDVLAPTATSELVVNLPTDGSSVFVTLWYKDDEGWKHDDSYQFTAFDDGGAGGSSTPPTVTSHTSGGSLTSATETFTWADVGADNYWLQIGSSAGRNDYHDSGQLLGTVTSKEVSDLPGDGTSIIHVRIWYKSNGRWEHNTDTSYTAATVAGSGAPTSPTMTSPNTGTSLNSATQTFAWSAVSDSNKYWLQIGTSTGRNDFYDSSELSAATDNAEDLPTDGSVIHVRVWAFIGGKWIYEDFTYNDVTE